MTSGLRIHNFSLRELLNWQRRNHGHSRYWQARLAKLEGAIKRHRNKRNDGKKFFARLVLASRLKTLRNEIRHAKGRIKYLREATGVLSWMIKETLANGKNKK